MYTGGSATLPPPLERDEETDYLNRLIETVERATRCRRDRGSSGSIRAIRTARTDRMPRIVPGMRLSRLSLPRMWRKADS